MWSGMWTSCVSVLRSLLSPSWGFPGGKGLKQRKTNWLHEPHLVRQLLDLSEKLKHLCLLKTTHMYEDCWKLWIEFLFKSTGLDLQSYFPSFPPLHDIILMAWFMITRAASFSLAQKASGEQVSRTGKAIVFIAKKGVSKVSGMFQLSTFRVGLEEVWKPTLNRETVRKKGVHGEADDWLISLF